MSKEIMEKLQAPFSEKDIEWRVQQSGKKQDGSLWAMVLAYVSNRAIQNRFDDTFGIFGWKNEFKTAPDGGVLCGISVKVEDEWITKWDGAENTQIEAIKGGLSGAMKRAAVQWGVGRYLYNLESSFAIIHPKGKHFDKMKDKTGKVICSFKWDYPKLPDWALPENERGKQNKVKEQNQEEPEPDIYPGAVTSMDDLEEENKPVSQTAGEITHPKSKEKKGHRKLSERMIEKWGEEEGLKRLIDLSSYMYNGTKNYISSWERLDNASPKRLEIITLKFEKENLLDDMFYFFSQNNNGEDPNDLVESWIENQTKNPPKYPEGMKNLDKIYSLDWLRTLRGHWEKYKKINEI